MRFLPVRLHTTRNYHSSINNLTTALWSDMNTRLNNLSTTTNFIIRHHLFLHQTCKFLVSCEYRYIPDQQWPTTLTNRFSGKRYVLSATATSGPSQGSIINMRAKAWEKESVHRLAGESFRESKRSVFTARGLYPGVVVVVVRGWGS